MPDTPDDVKPQSSSEHALAQLLKQYPTLKKIAARQGAMMGARTLQATAIVNEALLKLLKMVESGEKLSPDPVHLMSLAARVIQQVARDDRRRRRRRRRGGGVRPVRLDSVREPAGTADFKDEVQADRAIRRFEARFAADRRELTVFRLRYFAGMSTEQVADALGVSTRTVERDMEVIRAWFNLELRGPPGADGVAGGPIDQLR
ncbi:MAG: sigma-70 family RNA polymerase sigma factor [Phycisphaerales bacterium]